MVAKSDAGIRFSNGRVAAGFAEKQAQRTPTTKPGFVYLHQRGAEKRIPA
jgi:hypothetical protein